MARGIIALRPGLSHVARQHTNLELALSFRFSHALHLPDLRANEVVDSVPSLEMPCTTLATIRRISESEWDALKDTLAVLYQKKSLKHIISHMGEHHGFHARCSSLSSRTIVAYRLNSKAQYVRQFQRWAFQKYGKETDWKAIGRTIKKREATGKVNSQVFINGSLVPMKKLRKELSRHCLPTFGARSPTPELSIDVVVSTPPSTMFEDLLDCSRLPWFEFEVLVAPSSKFWLQLTTRST